MAASTCSETYRDSRFCCNICLESVLEPVVTFCGHLFCWPCLFRWLEPGMTPEEMGSTSSTWHNHRPIDNSRRNCPVCKANCRIGTVVPIYVRTSEDAVLRAGNSVAAHASDDELIEASSSHDDNVLRRRRGPYPVPARPTYDGSRSGTGDENPSNPSRNTSLLPSTASRPTGLTSSLQQALFGYNNTVPPLHRPIEDQEQDPATEFLSRLLLMLGSFVVLCLLLF